MAQATDYFTTTPTPLNSDVAAPPAVSRRAFINTIAALSVTAPVPAATAQTIDADLIDLGARFEPLVDQYYVARKCWALSDVKAHAEYIATVADHPEHRGSHRVIQDCWERWGVEEALVSLLSIKEKMDELTNAINAAPVSSIAGLRVKALAAFWQIAPENADSIKYSFGDHCAFQPLFAAVAELCELSGKIAATGYQLPDVTMNDDDDVGGQEIDAAPASITIR